MVLWYFSALVAICAFIGWGIRGLLAPNKDTPPGTTLAVGYAVGVVVFFPAYFALSSATQATICVLLFATGINVIRAYRIWRAGAYIPMFGNLRRDWQAYTLFIFTVLFSAITYIASGAGGYWHTANEDIFDGLNGRNAYIKNELLDSSTRFEVTPRIRAKLDETLKTNSGITTQKDAAFFKERYVHDLGLLQYSSLAFISELLKLPKGMDVFFLQALLNLGLFALGVHAFARRVLCQPQSLSIAIALMASVGNFYLASYFNGHEGSLMYNAVVPFVFYFLVMWIRDAQPMDRTLLIPALLLVLVIGAYPYPLPYLVAPVVLYYILKRFFPAIGEELLTLDGLRQHRNLILSIGLIAVLAFIAAYLLAEPMRVRALGQFRSWGTVHNHIGFMQFWGIWPSNLAYTGTPMGWLNSHPAIKIFSVLFACALSFIAIYGGIRLVKQKISFLSAWSPIAVLFFFVMRFAVYDSYYVYKYLYINAWIVYALTVVGLVGLAKHRHAAVKLLVIFMAVCWAGANLASNASAMWEISNKPFNKNAEKYYGILSAPRDILEQSYIAIPQNDHADLVRQILSESGISTTRDKAKARFILLENGRSDILKESKGKNVWESEVFSLAAMPDNDVMELASFWGVEGVDNPFRWVSDGRNGTVMLGLYNRTERSKYLFLCGESGPSVAYRPVPVKVVDAEKKLAGTMIVSSYSCHTVDVSKYQPPFSLGHDEAGVIASYIDQRKLVYRVMHIGFSSTDEIDETYLTLSSGKDIVDERYSKQDATPRISLGANWHSFETYQGESFRWASDYPEIIVSGSAEAGALAIDVAPGPSVGKEILGLELLDASNNVAGKCIVAERRICTFPISADGNGKSKYRFHSDALGVANSADPRILNFRIFNIGWQQ